MIRRILLASVALAAFTASAGAHPGTGIVVDGRGRIYFTDLARVWRIDPDGTWRVAVPEVHTHALFLDPPGNVTGERVAWEPETRTWQTRIWTLTPDGRLKDALPTPLDQHLFLSALVDGAGNRYFAEVNNNLRQVSRIWKRSPGGASTLLAGGAWGHADGKGAAARLGSIGGMALLTDGTLYVTDGAAVRRVAPDGTVTTLARGERLLEAGFWARFVGRANHLMGIAVSSRAVYAANYGNRRVLRIEPDGRVRSVYRAGFPWSPTGVALAGEDLVVLEYRLPPQPGASKVRVRRIRPGQSARTLALVRGAS